MRLSFKRYLLWVLAPTGFATLGAQALCVRSAESHTLDSASRMGAMATLLFFQEMGARSEEMAHAAPLLGDPDLESPILLAASRGDTVVALSITGEELMLSVAFAVEDETAKAGMPGEEPEEPSLATPQLRAVTEPFHPLSLGFFHTHTGLGAALYLRGLRAAAAPPDFGPARMGTVDGDLPSPAPLADVVILPLTTGPREPSGTLSSPTRLLVASPRGLPATPSTEGGIGFIILPLILGMVSWGILMAPGPAGSQGTGPHRAEPRRKLKLRLLTLTALPLGALWIILLGYGKEISSGAEELQTRDLVRVLGLLSQSAPGIDLIDVAGRTGFEALRRDGDVLLDATLPPGPLLAQVMALSPPPPDLPVQGTLREGGTIWAFAASREGPDRAIVLLARQSSSYLGSLPPRLAALGSVASLLSLGFLLANRRGP
jgi:hypothetical protein